jgi:hypothetical protein
MENLKILGKNSKTQNPDRVKLGKEISGEITGNGG